MAEEKSWEYHDTSLYNDTSSPGIQHKQGYLNGAKKLEDINRWHMEPKGTYAQISSKTENDQSELSVLTQQDTIKWEWKSRPRGEGKQQNGASAKNNIFIQSDWSKEKLRVVENIQVRVWAYFRKYNYMP